jgi:hypothetical protein
LFREIVLLIAKFVLLSFVQNHSIAGDRFYEAHEIMMVGAFPKILQRLSETGSGN